MGREKEKKERERERERGNNRTEGRVNYSRGGAFLLPLGLRAKPPRLLTPQLFTLSKPRLFHRLKILPISWKAIVNQPPPRRY